MRPEEFLERMKEKERKAKPFDFSFGALAPEYSRDPNELVDDPVSPAKDSSVPGTTPAALNSIGDLTDCSAEATNDFYRRWRKANGIRTVKSDGIRSVRAKRPATGKKK